MRQKNFINLIFILILFFIFSNFSEAIDWRTLGFKVGYTSSQLRAEDTGANVEVKKYATNGLTIGLVSNIKITNWLFLQPELLYSQKGGKYDVQVPMPVEIPGFQVNVVDKRMLDYLEIPILLKVTLPLNWKVKPTFLTGLSSSFKLKGKLENTVNIKILGYNFSYFQIEDIKSQLNAIELSYIIGGGLDFEIGKGKLALDQRFSFGLNKNKYETAIPASYFQAIGIPVPADIVYRLNMYNYVFSVSLAYLF